MTQTAEPIPAEPIPATTAVLPPHLKPIDGPPPADYVSGQDNSVIGGKILTYRYTSGREYRLTFTNEQVTFEMLDATVMKPEYRIPVSLPYIARSMREGQVLVHWMVPGRSGHVAIVIDFDENKLYVAALMPLKLEFFDEAVISKIEAGPA